MRFEILNVEHGFSAYAVANDGKVLLFDCGHSTSLSPATHLAGLGINTIHRLFIMNYDQDHIADLPALREQLNIEILTCNTSVSANQLVQMKQPTVTSAMQRLVDMRRTYDSKAFPTHEGIDIQVFRNPYPEFTAPNDLSLLVFMQMNGLSVVLPGDLEIGGWTALLKNQEICKRLSGVSVFVASHHGRENGYCKGSIRILFS